MKSTALVTGGAGSVGRCVVQRLCENGFTVRVFDLPHMDYTGLEGEKGIEVVRGDLTKADSIQQAVSGIDALIHLAALLPPVSEKDRDLTFSVNVDGTVRLAEALKQANRKAHFVFSSSVATYGDTSGTTSPVTTDHPQQAIDIYAESKIAAEKSLLKIYPEATVLRISGISVPSIQMPPEKWPFMADQRIEFVHRDDVMTALCNAITAEGAEGQVFNIAGGATWRTTGRDYVNDYYGILGVDSDETDEARFQEKPGWCDWYDTADSQDVLRYQNTPYEKHLDNLRAEVERMMA